MAATDTRTPRERVEDAILACYGDNYEPTAREVAEILVDEDVSDGLYEGCSSELEGLVLRLRADRDAVPRR